MFGAWDKVFDLNGDGKLDAAELAAESSFLYHRKKKQEIDRNSFIMQSASEEPEIDFAAEERDFLEQETGYDYESLELMDEWERREVLEDAGLDADDYDFW